MMSGVPEVLLCQTLSSVLVLHLIDILFALNHLSCRVIIYNNYCFMFIIVITLNLLFICML